MEGGKGRLLLGRRVVSPPLLLVFGGMIATVRVKDYREYSIARRGCGIRSGSEAVEVCCDGES